jgi:3-oxoacyl-[acyl-carrier protein] reductase
MDLLNKVAIVTGAARGIGAGIADYLSSQGASVLVADVNLTQAQSFADELNKKGRNAIAVQVDISSVESVEQMVKTAIDKFKKIDILVNNAGIIDPNCLPDTLIENWDKVISVNLRGTYLCSKIVIQEMVKNKSGKIINIGSMAGENGGLKAGPDYSASKAGIICLAKSFAKYGAQYGITANVVCPGFIETDMTKGRDDPSSVPLGRLGTPEDIAKVVYFLASSLSDYITGATIDVNGGLLMR